MRVTMKVYVLSGGEVLLDKGQEIEVEQFMQQHGEIGVVDNAEHGIMFVDMRDTTLFDSPDWVAGMDPVKGAFRIGDRVRFKGDSTPRYSVVVEISNPHDNQPFCQYSLYTPGYGGQAWTSEDRLELWEGEQ